MPTTNDGDEPNPFAAFEEAGPIFGFVHHQHGEQGLRQLLAHVVTADPKTTREFLEGAASELREAGLAKPAEIVLEAAAKTPSEFIIGNPYPEGSLNWSEWRKNWLRKRRQQSPEFDRQLRRRHSRKRR
jgi:hypothetical protein